MKKGFNFDDLVYIIFCIITLGFVYGMRIIITMGIKKALENKK